MSALKIGVTVGDGCSTQADFNLCLDHGVSMVRFNLASASTLRDLRQISEALYNAQQLNSAPVEVLFDLPFPKAKIRYNTFHAQAYDVAVGDSYQLISPHQPWHSARQLRVPTSMLAGLRVDDQLLIGDGELRFEVVAVAPEIVLEAKNNWFVSDAKAITLTGRPAVHPVSDASPFVSLTTQGLFDNAAVALSFVESAADVQRGRAASLARNGRIYSKIETAAALEHIEDIVRSSDALIVARGDLALQGGLENMAAYQNTIIERCHVAQTPVYVATEIFASLKDRDIPLRAELSDFHSLSERIHEGGFLLTKESSMPGILGKALKLIARLSQ
jgi:pyruvate kinase